MSKPGDFSSQSVDARSAGPAKSYPSSPKVDTSVKSKDKDDMVGLNDKFIQLIDKVKALEDENRTLDTKLKALKNQGSYDGRIDDLVKQEKNDLKQQIEDLLRDQEKLQGELLRCQEEKEDTKKRYEEEKTQKDDVEKDCVLARKDLEEIQLNEVELILDLEELTGKLEFLRAGFNEEIKELEPQIQSKKIVLSANNKRSLDMDDIVEKVKLQYSEMASRSREEAEQWQQKKMDHLVSKAVQREQDMRNIKRDISDLVRLIQRLQGELDALARKEDGLKKDIDNLRSEGEGNLEKARKDIAKLEEALRLAKQELATQIREFQELINLKMALDMEIATYQKLLEGEEERMDHMMRQRDVHLPLKPEKPRAPEPTSVQPTTIFPEDTIAPADTINPAVYPTSKKRLLIRVQVQSGRVVSESSSYTED